MSNTPSSSNTNPNPNPNFVCHDGLCYWRPKTNNLNLAAIRDNITGGNNLGAPSHLSQLNCFPMPQDQTPWTVYGAEWCPFCTRAKSFLEDNGAEFIYHDLEEVPDGKSSSYYLDVLTNGYQKIPMVFYYGKFIGGYTELQKFWQGN